MSLASNTLYGYDFFTSWTRAHLLASHCSLCSRTLLQSFVRTLALSLAPQLMGKRFLSRKLQFHPTVHYSTMGWNCMKSTHRVLSHSLIRSHFCSHRSLIRLLRTDCFARALRYDHLLAPLRLFPRLLAHLFPSSWKRDLCLWIECVDFKQFLTYYPYYLGHMYITTRFYTYLSRYCSDFKK